MILGKNKPTVAIVGISRECASVMALLIETDRAEIVKILNPEWEDLADLRSYPQLDIVIDATNDPEVYSRLKKLNIRSADIMSGLSARILFAADKVGSDTYNQVPFQHNRQILDSLQQMGQVVHLTKNKEELLKLVLNVTLRSTGADSGSIMLLDKKKKYLKIESAEGLDDSIVRVASQKIGSGISGTVVKTGKPLLIRGPADRKYYNQKHERKDIVSAICVPMIMGAETIGTLCINSKNPQRIFDEKDLDFVLKIADITVDIVKTSKEYEISIGNSRLNSLINDAREILNLSQPLAERINLLTLKIVNFFSGEICNYYEYNPENGVFLAKASSAVNFKLLQGAKLRLHDYFASQVIRKNSTVSLLQRQKDSTKLKWYLAVPLFIDNEIKGLLFVHFFSEATEMNDEIAALQKIISMLAVEIKKESDIQSCKAQSLKLSAISEVSFDLASAKTLAELANAIISHSCIIFEAESSILRLVDPQNSTLKVFDSFSIKRSSQLGMLQQLDAEVSTDAVTEKIEVFVKDIVKSKYARFEGLTKSFMCMYLQRNEKLLGTLSLYDKKSIDFYDSKSFSQHDKEAFLSFCLQAAKALEKFIPITQMSNEVKF